MKTHKIIALLPLPNSSMSDLNINILVQSIENLSQQVVKSESATKQDNASLTKAKALLDGLKGMFGIQAITLEAAGDMVDVTMTVLDYKVHFILDPAQELKLCDVKVYKDRRTFDLIFGDRFDLPSFFHSDN